MEQPRYRQAFSGNIELTVGQAIKIFAHYPASLGALTRVAAAFPRAERTRAKLFSEGVEVPPLMICSTTEQCNLTCAGCYSCARQHSAADELSAQRVTTLFDEASELGVSVVMLAGGEPLLAVDWLDALGAHPELLGVLFTNGTLLGDDTVRWFGAHRHIIPAISIEGDQAQTDARRGDGVHAQAMAGMAALKKAGIPFGVSITVTAHNIDTVLTDAYIKSYQEKGCALFVFVEYVPVAAGSEPMVLTHADKRRLQDFSNAAMRAHPVVCVPFPGDEDQYGGCLAAGRGFVHISATGQVEPCPFAPFADRNLTNLPLKEALGSELLAKVRENHRALKEGEGGCALWHNREWLATLTHPGT